MKNCSFIAAAAATTAKCGTTTRRAAPPDMYVHARASLLSDRPVGGPCMTLASWCVWPRLSWLYRRRPVKVCGLADLTRVHSCVVRELCVRTGFGQRQRLSIYYERETREGSAHVCKRYVHWRSAGSLKDVAYPSQTRYQTSVQ